MPCNERSHCNEKPVLHNSRAAPAHHRWKKARAATETQHSQKKFKKKKESKKLRSLYYYYCTVYGTRRIPLYNFMCITQIIKSREHSPSCSPLSLQKQNVPTWGVVKTQLGKTGSWITPAAQPVWFTGLPVWREGSISKLEVQHKAKPEQTHPSQTTLPSHTNLRSIGQRQENPIS